MRPRSGSKRKIEAMVREHVVELLESWNEFFAD